jgi:hypothetical protein
MVCPLATDWIQFRLAHMIQIESARAPFTSPGVAFQAIVALGRADAMGLLPADERIETLDLISFRKVVRHIHRAGIARTIHLGLGDDFKTSAPGLERTLENLNTALEESPVPEFEWNGCGSHTGHGQSSRADSLTQRAKR